MSGRNSTSRTNITRAMDGHSCKTVALRKHFCWQTGEDLISPCTVLDLWRIGGGGWGVRTDVALQPNNPPLNLTPPPPFRHIRNVNFILCNEIKYIQTQTNASKDLIPHSINSHYEDNFFRDVNLREPL